MSARRVISVILVLCVPELCDAGTCTADDLSKIDALPKNSSDNSFAAMSAKCGRAAYHIFGGFDQGDFNTCLTKALGISGPCSECYAVAGDYGAKNCKMKCMSKWCTSGCLSCTAAACATANTCAGRPNVQVKPCASSEVEEVEEVAETATADGACTADDSSKIDALPKDTSDSSFGGVSAKCGKSAYSIFSGKFDQGKFNTCMNTAVGISSTCSGCYAVAGAYGASNCKSKCIFHWCSSGCLGCTAPACAKANTCAGRPNPPIKPCSSSEGTAEVVV